VRETFSNVYDYDLYTGVMPKLKARSINAPEDLSRLEPQKANHPVLSQQVKAVASIRKSLRDVPIIRTVFSPLSVLHRGNPEASTSSA
jgi:uroporphyrinogen decarboxylase